VLVGGWLSHASKDFVSVLKSKNKLSFYVLSDELETLLECKDETMTFKHRSLNYALFHSITGRYDKANQLYYIQIYPEREKPWLLVPIQKDNTEIIVRWVAALRYRGGMVPESVDVGRKKAEKAVLWTQAQFRMYKAKQKARRRQERRKGLMNRIGGFIYGFDDTDSEGEDDAEAEKLEEEAALQGQSNSFLSTFANAFASDMFERNSPKNAPSAKDTRSTSSRREKTKNLSDMVKRSSRNMMRRRSMFKAKHFEQSLNRIQPRSSVRASPDPLSDTYLQESFALNPLESFEIEDELWQNERWQFGLGWGSKALLPTDRAPFSDRIGRGEYNSLKEFGKPSGWVVTSDWQIDDSGQGFGSSGNEGWSYAIDFPPLDSGLAKGKPVVHKTMRSLVRHRRWFRRRMPKTKPRTESFVVWHGWLGRPSSTAGRFQSRYHALTRGLRLLGKVTGVALIEFRSEFPDHNEVISMNDLEKWNALTSRQIKIINLDGAHILRNTQKKSRTSNMRAFQVRVESQHSALKFVADSINMRDNWIAAIEHSVKDQFNRFTLAKSLEFGSHSPFPEIPRHENAVLDRLIPVQLEHAVEMLYFNSDFDKKFWKKCGYVLEEEHAWSKDKLKGSRRKLIFSTKGRKSNEYIYKYKISRAEASTGYQLDMSIQCPTSAWGNISQDELRIVMSDWKGKSTRLSISHQVNLRSDDDKVRTFIQSHNREQIIGLFIDKWLPLVHKQLKEHRKRMEESNKPLTLSSPTGIRIKLRPQKTKKGKTVPSNTTTSKPRSNSKHV